MKPTNTQQKSFHVVPPRWLIHTGDNDGETNSPSSNGLFTWDLRFFTRLAVEKCVDDADARIFIFFWSTIQPNTLNKSVAFFFTSFWKITS